MSNTPIEHLGLLSDCRTAALIDREGTVQWMCLPYIDSPSVFGRLLDDDAGHVTLAPTGAHTTERAYRDATLVLETTFRTDTGTVVVTDALALGVGERGHDLGRNSSGILLRRAVVTDGTVEMRIELAPRPEYGKSPPAAGGDRRRSADPGRRNVHRGVVFGASGHRRVGGTRCGRTLGR